MTKVQQLLEQISEVKGDLRKQARRTPQHVARPWLAARPPLASRRALSLPHAVSMLRYTPLACHAALHAPRCSTISTSSPRATRARRLCSPAPQRHSRAAAQVHTGVAPPQPPQPPHRRTRPRRQRPRRRAAAPPHRRNRRTAATAAAAVASAPHPLAWRLCPVCLASTRLSTENGRAPRSRTPRSRAYDAPVHYAPVYYATVHPCQARAWWWTLSVPRHGRRWWPGSAAGSSRRTSTVRRLRLEPPTRRPARPAAAHAPELAPIVEQPSSPLASSARSRRPSCATSGTRRCSSATPPTSRLPSALPSALHGARTP